MNASELRGPLGKIDFFFMGLFKEPYTKIGVNVCKCGHLWPIYNLLGCSSKKIIYVIVFLRPQI